MKEKKGVYEKKRACADFNGSSAISHFSTQGTLGIGEGVYTAD